VTAVVTARPIALPAASAAVTIADGRGDRALSFVAFFGFVAFFAAA